MKKTAIFVARKDFRDEEFTAVKKIFDERQIYYEIFSSVIGTLTGKLGLKIQSHKVLAEFKQDDFDAMCIIGGPGAEEFVGHPEMAVAVSGMLSREKIVAAICMAPLVLAMAGVLKGKKATVFPSYKDDLSRLGATVLTKPVVQDGLILTADGPKSSTAFAALLVSMLLREEV